MDTPYRPINWSDKTKDAWEVVAVSDMNQVAANLQWIKENTPRFLYKGLGASNQNVTSNMRIFAGKVNVPASPRSDSKAKDYKFPANTFLSGSHPHITTAIEGAYWIDYHKLHVIVQGLGGSAHPDYRGFRVYVNNHSIAKSNDRLPRPIRIHFIAYGQAPAEQEAKIISAPTPAGGLEYPDNAASGASRVIQ